MRKAAVNINGASIVLNVEGDTIFGDESIMLLEDDDLTKDIEWHADGYTVVPFLSDKLFKTVNDGIEHIVRRFIEKEIGKPLPDFTLAKYHEFCSSNELHLAVVKHFQQCLSVTDFPIDYHLVEKRISEICGIDLACFPASGELPAKFCIRIVRPQKNTDNNPPHRDVWLDRLRNAVNIYLPLAGSNAQSSLPIIPGSHFWKESDIERTASGSKVNNVAFTVPCVVGSIYGLNMVRPLPKENEVMVFSPYLIHGGGCNLNEDETRVSLEMRFWRQATHEAANGTSAHVNNLNKIGC